MQILLGISEAQGTTEPGGKIWPRKDGSGDAYSSVLFWQTLLRPTRPAESDKSGD